jgi:hypothetical protein
MKSLNKRILVIFFFWILVATAGFFLAPRRAEASCGMNIDPANPRGFPRGSSLSGVDWVRIEFKDCTLPDEPLPQEVIDTYNAVFDEYRSHGTQILLIIDYLSVGDPTNPANFGQRAAEIASIFGSQIGAYEIWNEEDHPRHFPLAVETYAQLLSAAIHGIRGAGDSTPIIVGGLAYGDTGSSSYLSRLRRTMSSSDWDQIAGIGVHPYGKQPPETSLGHTGDLATFINNVYADGGGKPLWLTEVGFNSADSNQQKEYLEAFFRYANSESKIVTTVWFCWSDGMVAQFGITGFDGVTPENDYDSFFNVGCGTSPPSPALTGYSVVPRTQDGVSCGFTGLPLQELPPNRQTEWGDPVYGRNIPCRPLEVSQWLWYGFSWKDYSKPYFYYLPPLHYPEATGFPFDYSPWRPYPGDSGRVFYDHEGNRIWQGEAKRLNKCYDLTTLHKLNNEDRPLEDYITTYCNPAPEITDVFRWFPKDPGGETKYFETFGRFRAWWTDHPDKRISTQVPFLGNSLTSSREFTEHTQRMSLFVTDFLRGTVYWDRKDIGTTNPEEYRRILDESGPVRKLMPHERTNTWGPDSYRNYFLACRVFKSRDESLCGGEKPKYPLLHRDPVHDYVVLYTLKQNGKGRIIEEEDFENLPDRRKVKEVEIKIPKKDIPMPIRLSSYWCYLKWGDKPPAARDPFYICPEGNYGNLEFMTGDATLHGYFPLTSREDVPVFVDVAFEGLWYPEEDGNPPGMLMTDWSTFEELIEKIYQAIEEGYYGPSGYERYNGLYFIKLGPSQEYFDGQGRPYQKYEFHFVDLAFIPYVAETRELGEWAGLSLTPFSLDWEKDEVTKELKFEAGKGQLCNLEEIVRGGPGDVVAGDWRHSLSLITNPYDPNKDPYHIGNENERELWFLNKGKDTVGPNPDWGYDPLDPTRWPDRATSRLKKKGWITTYIPYLTQIGQRLIGQAGVFKTLLPHDFNQEVISLINQATQGEVFWHELPGYGPAYFKYYNSLKDRMSKKEQWGICQMIDPEDPSQMIDVPCPLGPDTEVTGWEEVNDEDARFYYPYIGTIDIFRKYFMNEMVPGKLVRF